MIVLLKELQEKNQQTKIMKYNLAFIEFKQKKTNFIHL